MEKQIALFKLCFENKLTFESHPKHDLIQVMEFDEDSEFLFRENLYHPTDFKIDELISKVEKHIESKKLETARTSKILHHRISKKK